tara:strand:+ start:357 stop:902 length:546 start_codon:yes stop_codon:yes gene_type:complete
MRNNNEISVGDQFEDLIVLDDVGIKKRRRTYRCACSCGTRVETSGSSLKTGRTKRCISCAMRLREEAKETTPLVEQFYNHDITLRAKYANIQASLTLEEYSELVNSNCHYCGQEPQLRSRKERKYVNTTDIAMNGIDRKDNDEGYHLHNCLPCCTTCNMMKYKSSYWEFKEKIRQIYEHLN